MIKNIALFNAKIYIIAKERKEKKVIFGKVVKQKKGTNKNRQGHIPLTDEDLAESLQTGKRQSTRNKKNRMVEEGQSPILTTAQSITSFIKDAISGKTKHVTKVYGKVGADLAAAVAEKSGGKLDISGKYLELSADELKHSYDVHHNPKQAGDIPLSQEHFENIIDYIDNFDDILYVQIVAIAREYIDSIGGFEKFAEWGLY